MSSPILLTNPLSYYWRQENLKDHPRRQRYLYVTYLVGMGGYAFKVAKRVVEVAYCSLRILTSFFVLLACRGKLFQRELHKWTVGFCGAFAWTSSALIGTICPPLAYRFDEGLYRHPILRETLWTSIKMDRENKETLARWDLQTTIGCFAEAINLLGENGIDVATRIDDDLFKIRKVGLFLAMRDHKARNELALHKIDLSPLYEEYHVLRGTSSTWERWFGAPTISDEILLTSLLALLKDPNATNEVASSLLDRLQSLANSLVDQNYVDTVLMNDAYQDAVRNPLEDLTPYVQEVKHYPQIVDGDLAAHLMMCFLVMHLGSVYRLDEDDAHLKGALDNARHCFIGKKITKERVVAIYSQRVSGLTQNEIAFKDSINSLTQACLAKSNYKRMFDSLFYIHPFGKLKEYIVKAMQSALLENEEVMPTKELVAKLTLIHLVISLRPPYKVNECYQDLLRQATEQIGRLTPRRVAQILLEKIEAQPGEAVFFETLSKLKEELLKDSDFKRYYKDVLGPAGSSTEKE